jgi:hypothetical protein
MDSRSGAGCFPGPGFFRENHLPAFWAPHPGSRGATCAAIPSRSFLATVPAGLGPL